MELREIAAPADEVLMQQYERKGKNARCLLQQCCFDQEPSLHLQEGDPVAEKPSSDYVQALREVHLGVRSSPHVFVVSW